MLIKQCPIGCDAGPQATTIELSEGLLQECPKCSHQFSACTAEDHVFALNKFETPLGYRNNFSTRHFENIKRFTHRIKLIKKILKAYNKIRLIDVGCNVGDFLLHADSVGFVTYGVEPAEKPAYFARTKGLQIFNDINHIDIDILFDVITMFEVIEHIPDPLPTVQRCFEILEPGGILMIGTGNTDSWTSKVLGNKWEYYDMQKLGGHISFFNPKSIRALAKKTGFNVHTIKTRRVLFKDKANSSKLAYTVSRLLSESISIFAKMCGKGHDMLVVLQKPLAT